MKKYFFITFTIIAALLTIIYNQHKQLEQQEDFFLMNESRLLSQIFYLEEQNDELNYLPEEIQREIDHLLIKKDNIVSLLGEKYINLSNIIAQINISQQELQKQNLFYLLYIKLEDIKFCIAVDKRLYDNIEEGDSLSNNWDIIVVEKQIKDYMPEL